MSQPHSVSDWIDGLSLEDCVCATEGFATDVVDACDDDIGGAFLFFGLDPSSM
jgi:hypothetical protein